jgi:hypothetical protein
VITDNILREKEIDPDLLTTKSGQTTGIVSLVRRRKRKIPLNIGMTQNQPKVVLIDSVRNYKKDF